MGKSFDVSPRCDGHGNVYCPFAWYSYGPEYVSCDGCRACWWAAFCRAWQQIGYWVRVDARRAAG